MPGQAPVQSFSRFVACPVMSRHTRVIHDLWRVLFIAGSLGVLASRTINQKIRQDTDMVSSAQASKISSPFKPIRAVGEIL